MKIILIQDEIEDAIRAYVGSNVNLEDRELDVDLTAGRGGNGFTATIEILSGNQAKMALVEAGPFPDAISEDAVDPSKPLFGEGSTV